MHFGRQNQRTSLNFLFKKEVNIYNLTMLNPNLKKKIRYHLTFFWKFSSCFFGILIIFTYILLESTIMYRPDALKSLFHVEMNIRNLKKVIIILYKNNFMQLHNKYVKINV